ncbi:MAG: ArsR family transcriptional regulator [Aquabacterium sp.]
MRERLDIDDPATAALLERPPMHHLVATLIERERTMAELVDITGMSFSLLSHHLRRLQAMGLVTVAGHTPRAGRACARYRATARSYYVPARLCRQLPGDRLTRDLRAALDGASGPRGLLFFHQSGPRARLVLQETRPDFTERWLRLRLSTAAARQFNEELRALFERWQAQQGASGRTYLLHGACAREPAARGPRH